LGKGVFGWGGAGGGVSGHQSLRKGVSSLAVGHGIICTGGLDCVLRLWDQQTFAFIAELHGHSGT
jgi:WD40 repeat protein